MKWTRSKMIVAGIAAGIAILAGAAWGYQAYAEYLIERQLQSACRSALQRELFIGSVDFNIWNNSAVIQNIEIENPEDYSQERPAISISAIYAEITPFALFQQLVHFKKLNISGIMLNVEAKKIPLSLDELSTFLLRPEINLFALQTERKRKMTRRDFRNQQHAKQPRPRFIRVDALSIAAPKLMFGNLAGIPGFRLFLAPELNLPEYHQANLGQDGNTTVAGLMQEILDRHLSEISKKISTVMDKQVKNLEQQVRKIETLQKKIKKLESLTPQAIQLKDKIILWKKHKKNAKNPPITPENNVDTEPPNAQETQSVN